ncbi:MAG: radical SAM family heme chaperone HemW, partial [Terriglobia bacterium]
MPSPLGIYIHVPFCSTKCYYCNFASGVYPESIVLPYLGALREEILGVKGLLAGFGQASLPLSDFEVDTVYFGGGTPSLIDAKHIAGLLRLVGEVFAMSANPEVTLEVNPGSVNPVRAEQHIEAGVNRVSMGMQTFQDEILKRIGRSHSVADSFATWSLYREAGIRNASLDLIAGLPGQTLGDWQQNLQAVEKIAPEHVSMYLLEIHESTRFGTIYGRSSGTAQSTGATGDAAGSMPLAIPLSRLQEIPLPDDDLVTEFYQVAASRFSELGYRQYEISNFALPERHSRHNLKYWTNQPFIGFGCGAYSYFADRRWGNERSVGGYIERIHDRCHAIDYHSHLSAVEHEEEALFLGLRLTDGIPLAEFQTRFGFDLRERYRRQIAHLNDAGLV